MNKHRIYIDQSGKVENTELPTVIAYSNEVTKSIEISSSEKRKLQKPFRSIAKPNIFVYKTFSCLIYLLLKEDLKWICEIVIDREYVGQEDLIRLLLLRMMKRGGDVFDPSLINFAEIGKKNHAHIKCATTFKRSIKPDVVVKSNDLLRWLF